MTAACALCGKALGRDEIAITKKLVNRGAKQFYCIPCLAERFSVTERDILDKIAYFRAQGCTLFAQEEGNG
ncbi:MAG: hypothetical protein IJ174_06320 [Clostridia bacterium]|nr:hypothetical protein [Clostridia bacterium]